MTNEQEPRSGAENRRLEPSLAEAAEGAVSKIVTAIVIAAAIIAIAIYARPAPPRYQAIVGDGQIIRIDSRSGTIIACRAQTCATILRRGQHLERHLPAPAAAPAPALPARPAATP